MFKPKNVMEIFKLLDKSNCRECGEKTCLAFASAVFQGRKNIEECPRLDEKVCADFFFKKEKQTLIENNQEENLKILKNKITRIDLAKRAEEIKAKFSGNKLALKIFGKEFSVDQHGQLYSDIHVNLWVAIPFFYYILYGKGMPVSGEWVSFRELKDGPPRHNFFQKRCEEPMKQLADRYPDLFNDIVRIFGGKKVEQQYQSDISVVLYPFPRVPIMLCYWKAEDGLDSSLNIFFDKTADKNLNSEVIFTMGSGITQMFEKIIRKHGFQDI